jgi:hypothetical protein
LPTPAGGYAYITRNNVTIDGYSQPGAVPNSNPILGSNNAQLKIVLDSRNGNYTSMGYDPTNTGAGFDTNEFAILGIVGGTNVNIRGLCLLGGHGDAVVTKYGIAIARTFQATAQAVHINGCWIGVDLNGSNVYGLDTAVAAYRHRDGTGVNPARPAPDGQIIGVAPGAINPRSEFNIFLGSAQDIDLEGQRHRISGNFLGVFPDGLHDYILPLAQPGLRSDARIAIGRGASDLVIGTDGDGINDADERNILGGVVTSGSGGSYDLGGYPRVIELYSLSGSPGPDRTRVKIAGNYIGVGIDGTTRFTNGVPMFNGTSTNGSQLWVGSDLDGVSDAIEGNVVFNNYPPGLFYATAYTNSSVGGSGSQGFFDQPDQNALYALRGNALVNNYPFPVNPGNPNGTRSFVTNYVNKALQTPTSSLSALYPVVLTNSTTAQLMGTVPVGNASFPWTILDLYIPDPSGLTNGLVVPDPNLPNGWVQGVKYLGSFTDNGPEDSNPAPGQFQFSIASLGLTNGTPVTVSANYSMDPPGTHNGRTLTSLFSPPVSLRAGILITSVTRSGSTLTINWRGGSPPYQLQGTPTLNPSVVWTNIGSPTALTNASATISGGRAFYRVQGN